jgi:hypothetical protein
VRFDDSYKGWLLIKYNSKDVRTGRYNSKDINNIKKNTNLSFFFVWPPPVATYTCAAKKAFSHRGKEFYLPRLSATS